MLACLMAGIVFAFLSEKIDCCGFSRWLDPRYLSTCYSCCNLYLLVFCLGGLLLQGSTVFHLHLIYIGDTTSSRFLRACP